MKKLSLFMVVIITFCTGCKKENEPENGLFKTKWTLFSIQNTVTDSITAFPAESERKITLVFTDSLNILLFNGVCNNGSGTYSLTTIPHEITISDIITTEIGCKYGEWEGKVTQILHNAFNYSVYWPNLVIVSNDRAMFFTTN
jgi:heat shock protein HslJ